MSDLSAPYAPGGGEVRDAFAAAAAHLRACASSIDAINVYPVPDGDTGSNMAATLREAADAALLLEGEPALPAVLAAVARGALYGARGNSGVILSQALRGLARGAGDAPRLDARALAAGLAEAAAEAYAAVGQPQEGTMLTVLRNAADAARREAQGRPGGACLPVLDAAVAAAEAAEAATIGQLPALAEAEVTDAGGEGVCALLRGLRAAFTGEAPRAPAIPARAVASRAGHESERFGFCTEFLVEARAGAAVDLDGLRTLAGSGTNRSVVVVGDEAVARVHVHTDAPEALIQAARPFGTVGRVKVEDMSAQHQRFGAAGSGAGARVALLALSRGSGFDAIFRGLGAVVADLGEVVKPPAGEIAAAAEAIGAADVVVLPNHANVLLAARQAAALARCTIHVVPTTSLAQGVGAAVAYDTAASPRENYEAMTVAATAVRTVEVTIAAASRRADGVAVRTGDAIALVEGRLVAATATPLEALLSGLERAGARHSALVTIYGGADLEPGALEAARAAAAAACPGADVESLDGGQPLYHFVASVEE